VRRFSVFSFAAAVLGLAAPAFAGDPASEKPAEAAPQKADETQSAPAPAANDKWSEQFDELDHVMALDQLNRRADEIQGLIAATMDRVNLLRESVIIGAITPSRTLIVHRNDMGSSFSLEQVAYFLDGQVLLTKLDKDGSLDKQTEFEVLNGAIKPGDHMLEVSMVFKGSGDGLFTYLKDYRFKVDSKYRLNVAEGRLTRVLVTAYPKPDITLPPRERLAVKYDVDVSVDQGE
jgi:hypothetical protein